MTTKNLIRVIIATLLSIAWFIGVWYWFVCYTHNYCLFSESEVKTTNSLVEVENTKEELTIEEQAQNLYNQVIADENTETDETELNENDESTDVISTSIEVTDESDIPKLGNVTKDSNANCSELIVSPIALGRNNDSSDVTKLQQFLNAYEGEQLEVDGIYKSSDNEAVKRFQEKYRSDILTPAGINNPTGYVYKGTIKKINELYCAI